MSKAGSSAAWMIPTSSCNEQQNTANRNIGGHFAKDRFVHSAAYRDFSLFPFAFNKHFFTYESKHRREMKQTI